MFFELRKLLKNRWLLMISLLLIIASSFTFVQSMYISPEGNDYRIIRNFYDHPESFLETHESVPTLSSNVETETLNRMNDQKNHSQSIKQLIRENALKMQLGITKSNYDTVSIQKSLTAFCKVQNLTVPVRFYGGTEKFLSSWYSSSVAILISLLCCFILFLQEKKEPVQFLINATQNGRQKLYRNKCLATSFFVIGIFLLMQLIEFGTASIMLGTGHFSDPVQGLYDMWLFPFHLNILEWIILSITLKCILLSAFTFCFILLSSLSQKEWQFFFLIGLFLLVSVSTYNSSSLMIRSLNPFRQIRIQEWMSSVIYLNICSIPVNRFWIILSTALCIQCIVFYRGFSFSKNTVLKTQYINTRHSRNHMKGILAWNEIKKYWIVQGGILILLIMLCLQIPIMKNFRLQLSQPEMFYSKYAQILTGEKNPDKEEYLNQEQVYLSQDTTGELYQRKLGFEMAVQQYNVLQENDIFANRLSYMWLKSHTGIKTILFFIFMMLSGICYPVSTTYGVEQESGMIILYNSTDKKSTVYKWKHICIFIHILFMWMICFLPVYYKVANIYGFYNLSVKASRLPYIVFLALTFSLEIGSALLYTWIIKTLANNLKIRNYLLAISIALIGMGILILLTQK